MPAPGIAALVGLLEDDPPAAVLAARLPIVVVSSEKPSVSGQQRLAAGRVGGERADRLEALQGVLGRNLRRARDERLVAV